MDQPSFWTQVLTVLKSFGAVAVVAVVLALAAWPFRSRRLLPLPRLRPGQWSGADVVLVLFWFFFMPLMVTNAVDQFGFFRMIQDFVPQIKEFSAERKMIWCNPLNFFLILAMSSFVLYYAHRTRWHDLGFSNQRWASNVLLGCAAFLLVTLPIYFIYLALMQIFDSDAHRLDVVSKQNLVPVEWALVGFSAVVIAPIQEEWLFRGLLQGWLRRASALGHCVFIVLAFLIGLHFSVKATPPAQPAEAQQVAEPPARADNIEIVWPRAICAGVLVTGYAAGVWVLWYPFRKHGLRYFLEWDTNTAGPVPLVRDLYLIDLNKIPLRGPRWDHWKYRNAQWSIVGSSVLFALVHMGNWPAPIPLFFFSLVLGWLALRTQNLYPSMVLHALFNLVATLSLFWG